MGRGNTVAAQHDQAAIVIGSEFAQIDFPAHELPTGKVISAAPGVFSRDLAGAG